MESTPLSNIKHILLVLSGKGGVGKSSVTTQLALTLAAKGFKVGILDIDLTGPSIPRMFGAENNKIFQGTNGWVPVTLGNIQLVSLAFLLNDRNNSVVWRGAKKTAMIQQFITDVNWSDLDYLLIDTPPGTSDEHIAIAELLKDAKPDGAVIVTTPQKVSIEDVRKEIDYCKKVGFSILGIVENLSGFICPHCEECTDIFSSGGGLTLANDLSIPYWGNVPIDPTFVELVENGNVLESYKDSKLGVLFGGIVDKYLSLELAERV